MSLFKVLIKLIKPYTRIHIPFISKELNIDASEVENLLASCILDNTIRGRIDQVTENAGKKNCNYFNSKIIISGKPSFGT